MTSDNLSAGDVVVCIDDSPCRCCNEPFRAKAGRVYRVIGARWGHNPRRGVSFWALYLDGLIPSRTHSLAAASNAERFRKIDAAEPCFTKAMRELRPLETAGEHTTTPRL